MHWPTPRPGTTGPAWRCRAADIALDRLLAKQGIIDSGARSAERIGGHSTTILSPPLSTIK